MVWLEPAGEGGKARWLGSARSLGGDVCQGMRTVLASGAPPIVSLSLRAQAALRRLADELPISLGTQFVQARCDAASPRTWTFAGTRANRTLARQADSSGQKIRFDALSVQAAAALLSGPSSASLTLSESEIAAFAASIKFAACVPRELLARTIVARNFDFETVETVTVETVTVY
jgi:ATP-dependent Lhr-like helicase